MLCLLIYFMFFEKKSLRGEQRFCPLVRPRRHLKPRNRRQSTNLRRIYVVLSFWRLFRIRMRVLNFLRSLACCLLSPPIRHCRPRLTSQFTRSSSISTSAMVEVSPRQRNALQHVVADVLLWMHLGGLWWTLLVLAVNFSFCSLLSLRGSGALSLLHGMGIFYSTRLPNSTRLHKIT